jgi:RNA polymerase sigma-70 factor (ECF subfamily)
VDQRVEELLRRARAEWPQIELADAVAAEHFAARPEADLHAADLYLSCACAAGVQAALSIFETRYLSQVKVFLGRMKPSPTLVDDVTQTLRVRLLVAAPGGVPRIVEYGGRGSLTSWLRVAAIRLAIDLLKQGGAPPPEAEPMLEQLGDSDPELELIKERYREQVNAALRDAFSALSAEQRNLLRLSYRDGRSIDELGALLNVHRATAARRVQEAREAILDCARRRLSEELQLGTDELRSLLALLRSQLHLSVSRLLRTPD